MKLSTGRALRVAGMLAALAGAAAAENKTISGYLIDRACSTETIAKGEKALAEHDRSCALMDPCLKSGYGVVTPDGKFVAFDAAGNKRAVAAIKASKKEKDYKVTVTGDQQGDTMKVASLKME